MKRFISICVLFMLTTCVFAGSLMQIPNGNITLVGTSESAMSNNLFIVDSANNVWAETINSSFESKHWQPILASSQVDSSITAIMGIGESLALGTNNGTVYLLQESTQQLESVDFGISAVKNFFTMNGLLDYGYANGLVKNSTNTICPAYPGYVFKAFVAKNNIVYAFATDITGSSNLLSCDSGAWSIIQNIKGLDITSITTSDQSDGSSVLVGTKNSYVYTVSGNQFNLLGSYGSGGFGLDSTKVEALHDAGGYVLAGTSYGLVWPHLNSSGMFGDWGTALTLSPGNLVTTRINYIDSIKQDGVNAYECEFSGNDLISLIYCSQSGSNQWYPVYTHVNNQ